MKSLDTRLQAKELGKRIAQKRIEAGLTQEAVAEILDIGTEAMSRIERGVAIPNVLRLLELAEIFGCLVEDLLRGGSARLPDQALHISKMLDGLSAPDRTFVVGMVEQMAQHLGD